MLPKSTKNFGRNGVPFLIQCYSIFGYCGKKERGLIFSYLVRKAAAREAGVLRREKQKGEKSREISPHVGREGQSLTLVDRQTPSTSK